MIYSPPMVRAHLAGWKTQTRRLLSPHNVRLYAHGIGQSNLVKPSKELLASALEEAADMRLVEGVVLWTAKALPYQNADRTNWQGAVIYEPGDRLWMRERFRFFACGDDCEVTYFADGSVMQSGPNSGEVPDESLVGYFKMVDRSRAAGGGVNYPSIHMPRWASRLHMLVTDVRIQRLQDISEADCIAEGPRVKGWAQFGAGRWGDKPSSLDGVMVHTDQEHVYATPRCWYRELWQSLHTKPGERWDDNPWVLALTYDVLKGNIDRV